MKSRPKEFRKSLARVDIQVSIILAIFIFLSTIITSVVYWTFAFDVMMVSLEDRVLALYDSVESNLDKETFYTVNSPEDMESAAYRQGKEKLLELRNGSGVLYLYTAKENQEGQLVYVIDGLETSEDFRFPGDLIEEEIQDRMRLALADRIVMPKNIVHTHWGDIFIAYLPAHDQQGNVIGVVGIEFDATHVYGTYLGLLKMTPFIILLAVSFGTLVAFRIFKRISNPLYLDMATVDSPTGLKNRNAYDVDMNNISVRGQHQQTGIIMIDLNGLKEVNDRLGHVSGDNYIRLVAEICKKLALSNMVTYRTGGDEFVVLVQDAEESAVEKYISDVMETVRNQKEYTNMRCSVSCGFGIFDPSQDLDLEDTYHRADAAMYAEKRRQKENRER